MSERAVRRRLPTQVRNLPTAEAATFLRVNGWPDTEIMAMLGYSSVRALDKDVVRTLGGALTADAIQDEARIHTAKLETVINHAMQRMGGDNGHQWAATALTGLRDMAVLRGFNAPKQLTHTVRTSELDEYVRTVTKQIAARFPDEADILDAEVVESDEGLATQYAEVVGEDEEGTPAGEDRHSDHGSAAGDTAGDGSAIGSLDGDSSQGDPRPDGLQAGADDMAGVA